MDPFYTPNDVAKAEYESLPKLSELGEMLIALHQPIMKIYRLKGGAYGFVGNVVNLVQNVDEVVHQLPRTLDNVNMIVVQKQTGEQPTDYRDFKVNKDHIIRWLRFLKAHNKYYSNIDIAELTLQNLPDSLEEVYNQLRNVTDEQPQQQLQQQPAPDAINAFHQNNDSQQPLTNNNDNDEHGLIDVDVNENDEDDDYGQHEGPVEQQLEGDNVLQTGYARPTDTLGQEEHIQQDIIDRLRFPDRDPTPIDEFNTPGLFAKTFPTKFPFGRGDPTDQDRRRIVTLNEAIKHFNR